MFRAVRSLIRDDWHRATRSFSVWLSGGAAALYTAASLAPDTALQAWRALPADLQALLPHSDRLAAALFASVFALRFIRQEKAADRGEHTPTVRPDAPSPTGPGTE
jgi:hypothetical protein